MSLRSSPLLLLALVGCPEPTPTVVSPVPTPITPMSEPPTVIPPFPSSPPPTDPCDTFELVAPAVAGPGQTVQLAVLGGVGPFRYGIQTNTSGGAINQGSGSWLVGELSGQDVVDVVDDGCALTLAANVEILQPLVALPDDATVPPALVFDLQVTGGTGQFQCDAIELGGNATLNGCTFQAGMEGSSRIEITDTVTGQTDTTTINVAEDARLLDQDLHLIPANVLVRPTSSGGSGDLMVPPTMGLSSVDGALLGSQSGTYDVVATDPITGMTQSITVVVAEALTVDPAVLPRDGEQLDDGQVLVQDLDGDGFEEVIVSLLARNTLARRGGTVAVYAGTPNGPSPAPAWQTGSDQPDSLSGRRITLADLDGDGTQDLAIGIYAWRRGALTRVGRVEIHRGIPGGLFEPSPTWTLEGEVANDLFGYSVASCDVNNDGVDDLIIGGPGLDDDRGSVISATGGVEVFYGTPAGPFSQPSLRWYPSRPGSTEHRTIEAGSTIATGDIDGDGLCDIAVGSHFGDALDRLESRGGVWIVNNEALRTGGPANAVLGVPYDQRDELGYQVALVDAPGSDFDALVVSARFAPNSNGNNTAGRVLAYTSQTVNAWSADEVQDAYTTADWSLEGATQDDRLGHGLDSAPGGALWIGIPRASPATGGGERGAVVQVDLDFAATPPPVSDLVTTEGPTAGGFFGTVVGQHPGGGFVAMSTRDQHPDRVPQGIRDAAIYSFDSAPGTPVVELELENDAVGGEFGKGVAWVDGPTGLRPVVSGPRFAVEGTGLDAGSVYSFDGSTPEAAGSPIALGAAEQLGATLRNIGDLNGDGNDDFAASGRFHTYRSALAAGLEGIGCPGANRSRSGAVYIWLGGSTLTTPEFAIYGLTVNDEIESFSEALDFDGDGRMEIAVGGTRNNVVRVHEHSWVPTAGVMTAVCEAETELSGRAGGFGHRLAAVPSLDGDGCDELAVTSPGDDAAGANRGSLRIFRGCTSGASWHAYAGAANNDELGRGGLVVANLFGDNTPEFVVGSPRKDLSGLPDAGSVWIAEAPTAGTPAFWTNTSGSTDISGFSNEVVDVPSLQRLGVESDEQLGMSLALGPDNLILVGRPGFEERSGEVQAWLVNASGFQERIYTIGPGEEGSNFGWSVAVSGRNVLVGAPNTSVAGPDAGAAYGFSVP